MSNWRMIVANSINIFIVETQILLQACSWQLNKLCSTQYLSGLLALLTTLLKHLLAYIFQNHWLKNISSVLQTSQCQWTFSLILWFSLCVKCWLGASVIWIMTPDTLVWLSVSLALSLLLLLIVCTQPVLPSVCFFLLSPFNLPHLSLLIPFFSTHKSPSSLLLPSFCLPPLWHNLGGIYTDTVYRSEKRFGRDYQHHDTTAFTPTCTCTPTHRHSLAPSMLSLHTVPAQIMKINVCFGKNGSKQLLCC